MSRIDCWTALGLLAACESTPVVVTPRSFDRPGRLAFVCYDNDDNGVAHATALEDCRQGTPPDPRFALHALVTQTGTGQVAAVDLLNNRILDSDVRVPGYTFVDVGETPSAVVTRQRTEPYAYTYVADASARLVRAIPTERFFAGSGEQEHTVSLDDASPVDMILSPDERALFVALADTGEIVRIALDDEGRLGEMTPFPLDPAVPEPVDPVANNGYCKSCLDVADSANGQANCDALEVPSITNLRVPALVGATPRPVALAVDIETQELFVADAALPIIHRFEVTDSGLTPLAPVVTSVPTRDVVVTPAVPATVPDDEGAMGAVDSTERYLYAIDAIDGSVLAVDLGAGAVVLVEPREGRPADRLDFDAPAEVLGVLAPSDPEVPGWCVPGLPWPATGPALTLRGVFLAVGLSDGTVRIVDVHDLNSTCRGGNHACAAPPADDAEAHILRHRPRLLPVPAGGVSVTVAPSILSEAGTAEVGNALGSIDCAMQSPPMRQVYPAEGDSTICAISDPWAAVAEQWTVLFEGLIPDTQGGRGRLGESPALGNSGEVPFVSHRVQVGDLLVITGEVPPSAPASCAADFLREDGTLELIDFRITAVSDDRVTLEDQTGGRIPFERVRDCFRELVQYEVRAGGKYTVVGSRTGFVGRANTGALFHGDAIAFTLMLNDPPRGEPQAIVFSIGQVPSPLGVDVGALPSDIAWSPTDQRLYVVDSVARGLVQLGVAPVELSLAFE